MNDLVTTARQGVPAPDNPQDQFHAAALTNRRLRLYTADCCHHRITAHTTTDYYQSIAQAYTNYPEYLTRLRTAFGLDATAGWYDRELANDPHRPTT